MTCYPSPITANRDTMENMVSLFWDDMDREFCLAACLVTNVLCDGLISTSISIDIMKSAAVVVLTQHKIVRDYPEIAAPNSMRYYRALAFPIIQLSHYTKSTTMHVNSILV